MTTVWVGKDSNDTIAEYGANAALPIWIDFMGDALEGTPSALPQRPDTIVTARVDQETGRRLHDDQPGGMTELFHRDHLPDFQPRRISQELEEASGSQGSGTAESIF